MDNERLEAIEAKLAYQDRTIHELNLSNYDQQKRIDELEKICKRLTEHVREISERDPKDEKPPHY